MRFPRKRKHRGSAKSDKGATSQDPSPSLVIDLTVESDNEENINNNRRASLAMGSTRKRLLSDQQQQQQQQPALDSDHDDDSVVILDDCRGAKKPKSAPKPNSQETTSKESLNDEVEIVDAATLTPPLVAASLSAHGSKNNNDEDVAIVGTKNHVDLVHMRQHCVDYPFRKSSSSNAKYCSGCYCYVCDVKASECTTWQRHCHATDQSLTWKNQRAAHKARNQTLTEPASSRLRQQQQPARSVAQSQQRNVRTLASVFWHALQFPEGFATESSASASSSPTTSTPSTPTSDDPPQSELPFIGIGPFPPTNNIGARANLTQCRYCKSYSNLKRPKWTYSHGWCLTLDLLNPVPLLQWCLECGRVASDKTNEGLQPNERFQPSAEDVLLGTKQIPFTLHVHDPRQMNYFSKKWKENKWTFDKRQMEQDLFQHRITSFPDITQVMDLLSPFDKDKIPTDGCLMDSLPDTNVSAAECDALLVPNENHVLLLTKLAHLSKSAAIKYQLTATWNAQTSQGVSSWTIPFPERIIIGADLSLAYSPF